MRILLLTFGLFLTTLTVQGQAIIKLEEVGKHVGDSVTVCGKVFSGRYLESASNTPTFINLGAAYPSQLLTIVIWGDVRKQFTGKPEDDWMNKDVCVTGRIALYKEKPQIVIYDSKQVKLTTYLFIY